MDQQDRRTRVVRSLRNGEVTIPADFRRELGIDSDSLLQLTLADGELRIRPVQAGAPTEGLPWLKEAYDAFADVRKHLERYGGDEIDAAIDEAVKAVQSQHASYIATLKLKDCHPERSEGSPESGCPEIPRCARDDSNVDGAPVRVSVAEH